MAAHEPRKDPRQRADALARSLTDLLAPTVNDAGLHLESVETTLGPVTAASSQALDEADPVKGQYTLEVSTPGAERELTTLRHFRRAVGHSARVCTADDELTGLVTAADGDDEADNHNGGMVGIEVDGVEHRIALGDITEARMVVAGL